MDFSLSEDQIALREAVRRCCDGEFAVHERGLQASPTLTARRHAALAELGLYGLTLPAAHGGSALGPVEAMLAAKELGRALAGASWLASTAVAAPLIAATASPAQQDRWLGAMARGSLLSALACEEPHARWDALDLKTTARRDAAGQWRLSGPKSGVLGGDAAALLLVAAQAPEGPTLFAVDCTASTAAGLQRQPCRLLDGRGAAHLILNDTPADPVGLLGGGAAAVTRACEWASAMLVADTVGAAEALLELTVEHLRTRQQFGKPLAAQQALQHRLADHVMALEQMHSMACVAALSLLDDNPSQRTRGISAARTLTSQLGRRLALDAIQLHGAMGMTEDCTAARYAKRLLTNGALFGDATAHRQRFAALASLTDPDGDTP